MSNSQNIGGFLLQKQKNEPRVLLPGCLTFRDNILQHKQKLIKLKQQYCMRATNPLLA